MELEELKSIYSKIRGKYSLPIFEDINEYFEIEKIDRESDLILKIIRKVMMEKIINSLNFIEMLYNPANLPRVYHSFIRGMTQEDKEIIDKLYSSFSFLSIDSFELEISSSEKLEADLIKNIYSTWKENEKDFKKIVQKIKKPNSNTIKKDKSYFG